MKLTILTLFPDFFQSYMAFGIIQRALESEHLSIEIKNIRDYSKDKHKSVDDYPFGGGAGMLMTPQPLFDAIEDNPGYLIHLSPRGEVLEDRLLDDLSQEPHLVIICSHYEGMDQRVIDTFKPREISIGDYVLSGGEISALVLIDGLIRKIPKVISDESLVEESFTHGLLEYDQWTRPRDFRGQEVPEVLLSGHHEKIERFRLDNAIRNTLKRRPDLLEKGLREQRFSEKVVKRIKEIREEHLYEQCD